MALPAYDVELLQACADGDLLAVRTAIAMGASVTCSDHHQETPLHWAVIRCHPDIVKELLETKKVDKTLTNIGGNSPLHFAAERRTGTKKGKDGQKANLEIVSLLVEFGFDRDQKDKRG